jgi:hypothetical protein
MDGDFAKSSQYNVLRDSGNGMNGARITAGG